MHSAAAIQDWQYTAAIVIFLVTYAIIISEKINRAVIALLGAVAMVMLNIVDLQSAFTHHIDWSTITLLIGMMILVHITSKSGVFQFTAIKVAKLAKGQPIRILLALSLMTAVASAFLDNVTTVLLVVPVTLSITRILNVNPVPFLISEVLFSNIGGTATLIGDPPNIMIGSANPHLTFNAFLTHLAPVVLIIMAVTSVILYFIYRKQLIANEAEIAKVMQLNEYDFITDYTLMKKSLLLLVITIIGFITHSLTHIDAPVIALAGATLLMAWTAKSEKDIEDTFASVEWLTIFFFAGLFTLVGGLVDIGLIKSLANEALKITGTDIAKSTSLILWISGIASATIDNIPFVATMIPLIQDLAVGMGYTADSAAIDPLWWALSLGACLGGNGTLIGASANVIVAGIASREGHGFSYWEFLKIGAPLTLIALAISHLYLMLLYFM